MGLRVLENALTNQKGIADDFLKIYFDYKGAAKTVSSYGQGHLNLINPNTGEVIGVSTGTVSREIRRNCDIRGYHRYRWRLAQK